MAPANQSHARRNQIMREMAEWTAADGPNGASNPADIKTLRRHVSPAINYPSFRRGCTQSTN
eukprot:7002171-Prorocentrum_lima.AAC.1